MPGTYDPQLNTIYWGTSNPSPDFDGGVRPGTTSTPIVCLALDPDTGKLKWYFQFTPHDLFDYDAVETPILIDAVYQGEARKLLVQANRNGYIYVLDRTNGKFLSATPFVEKLNWAKGIDSLGRPMLTRASSRRRRELAFVPVSREPRTGLRLLTARLHIRFISWRSRNAKLISSNLRHFKEGQGYYSTGVKTHPGENSREGPGAFNLDIKFDCLEISAAGTRALLGRDYDNGWRPGVFRRRCRIVRSRGCAERARRFGTSILGQDMSASPMSYAIDGKQYVAIAAGSDVFSFASALSKAYYTHC